MSSIMKEFTLYSNVVEGKLQHNVRSKIAEFLHSFNGKRVEIVIRKLSSRRSLQQNKYLHLLFGILSNELIELTGDKDLDPSKVKDMMKFMFLKRDLINQNTGEVVGHYVKKTSKLNKEEMSEFIESMKQWAAELGIYLPDANEMLEIKFG